ncbi:MAG: sulfite exporter TauE/SafE family protein [Candidatus Zixiibacteriota bacterium]
MEYWSALGIGLVGSLHCIGMCGPIAIALPNVQESRFKYTLGRIAYNLGRTLTYALLGLACGFVGQTIMVGDYQQGLSIALGILILLAVFTPSKYTKKLVGNTGHSKLFGSLKNLWGKMFGRSSVGALFVVGILNGFLPCGLVYLALAGSIATGAPVKGAIYMALFGMGTLPVMMVISLLGTLVGLKFKQQLRRLLPAAAVFLAVLFILRGMSLGIPYVSPKISKQHGETKVDCCHHETMIDSTGMK